MKIISKIKKILHWETPPKPQIDLNTELYLQLKPFRLPLILTVLMMMIGTLGYVAIDNFSVMDAIYQAGITFTTVGYGEIDKISDMGRIFTITFIILGFLSFSFAIGILVEVLNKGDLVRILKERRMLYDIARLKNHFVICHHNHYTIQLTRQFRSNHIPFVVIDASENLEEEAKKHNYPYFVQEEPHTEEAQLKSFLSSAKGVITLSDNIADNIAVIASTRLYQQEIKRRIPYLIMTNAHTLTDIEKLKKLGADSVVSPTKLMAQRMSAISVHPEMENILENFLYQKDSPLDIEEVKIPSHSWLRYKRVKDLDFTESFLVKVIGIRDKKGNFIPMPEKDRLIATDDTVLFIGTGKGVKRVKRIVRRRKKPQDLNDD